MQQNIPFIPRGLYRFTARNTSNDPAYNDDVCVRFGKENRTMTYRDYWERSYRPTASNLLRKENYDKYFPKYEFEYKRKTKGRVFTGIDGQLVDLFEYFYSSDLRRIATRQDFQLEIDEAKRRIFENKKTLDGRPAHLDALSKLDYEDYLASETTSTFENRLKLRIQEYNSLFRYINPHWKYEMFPPKIDGAMIYYIEPCEAQNLDIDVFFVPDNVTIKPRPGIKHIDWAVRAIKLGNNATFDLSAEDRIPATPPQQKKRDQAGPGCDGAAGEVGHVGMSGEAGVSLTLRGIESIEGNGSLWIRTDGGPGGQGGQGGPGQEGGNRAGKFWKRRAGVGGNGGQGGPGGKGGDTSNVSLFFSNSSSFPKIALAPGYAPSSRPEIPDGTVVIFGAGGRGGKGGLPGLPGGGRLQGEEGRIGNEGATGRLGKTIKLQYLGDEVF